MDLNPALELDGRWTERVGNEGVTAHCIRQSFVLLRPQNCFPFDETSSVENFRDGGRERNRTFTERKPRQILSLLRCQFRHAALASVYHVANRAFVRERVAPSLSKRKMLCFDMATTSSTPATTGELLFQNYLEAMRYPYEFEKEFAGQDQATGLYSHQERCVSV